jgi:predicted nuclease with TOPRIM domain
LPAGFPLTDVTLAKCRAALRANGWRRFPDPIPGSISDEDTKMGDYASQDDFDNLRDTTNGVTSQVISLSDDLKALTDEVKALTDKVTELSATIDELKSGAADQKPKVDKINQDLYESPKFISTEYKVTVDIAASTGILIDDTILTNPILQTAIAAKR